MKRQRPERPPINLGELAMIDREILGLLGNNKDKLFPQDLLVRLKSKIPNLTQTLLRDALNRLRDNGLVIKYEAWGPSPTALDLLIKEKEDETKERPKIVQRPVSSVPPRPILREQPSGVPPRVRAPEPRSSVTPRPAPTVRPVERIKDLRDLGKHKGEFKKE